MRWTIEQANQWQQQTGWLVGFNYLPATAINSTEMWQSSSFDPDTIARELQIAGRIGFNSCRVFLPYIVWANEAAWFLEAFERFLDIASACGLSVMPVLFDDCAFSGKEPVLGKQSEPIPGIHNSGWTPSPGFSVADSQSDWPSLRDYVQSVIGSHAQDARVAVWDIYNEPGNSDRKQKCLPLLRAAFDWAREANSSQPITAGVWAFEPFDLVCADLSDVISFHDYLPLDQTQQRVEKLAQYGRPMLCTEWLHRLAGNQIDSHLPFYKNKGVGVYNWGLVNGRTQTHLSWNIQDNSIAGAVWQHDLLRTDFSPYDGEEIELIRTLTH